MNAHVLAGYVDAKELRAVFTSAAGPGVLFILEAFADLRIGRVAPPGEAEEPTLDPTAYEEGRLFNEVFELHWQRLRGYPAHAPPFRVSLISDDEGIVNAAASGGWLTLSGESAAPVALDPSDEGSVYLWGEAVGAADGEPTGMWYEKEVPRLFRYPLGGAAVGPRVKLVTKSYRFRGVPGQTADDEAGSLQRFVAFTSA